MQAPTTPKIGLGVITLGIRQLHPYLVEKTHPDTLVRVQTDHQRQGVAKTRNACLRYLMEQGCDYIFLFDDDCYPVMHGWEQYFIDQHLASGIHFFALPEIFRGKPLEMQGEIVRWDRLLGCFCFQTRRLMEVVGYYNTAYDRYGYEDAARNWRCIRSGLCGTNHAFAAPIRTSAYICSEDVLGITAVQNMSQAEKNDYIARNEAEYHKERRCHRLYYPPE